MNSASEVVVPLQPQAVHTWLPKAATGELRLQAFGVTEPTSGTGTFLLKTFAGPQFDTPAREDAWIRNFIGRLAGTFRKITK